MKNSSYTDSRANYAQGLAAVVNDATRSSSPARAANPSSSSAGRTRWWHIQDRQVLERINLLIHEVVRDGDESVGMRENRPSTVNSQVCGRQAR